jgi:uncharacterized protein (DUF2225 family)
MTDDRELKVSFQAKKETECPLCNNIFRKEELLTGGGRMIAGELTKELHRLYLPSAKYGDVYPLIYQALVCPECWYASMDSDFQSIPPGNIKKIKENMLKRKHDTALIFPNINFNEKRGLKEGAASQYLVLRCYDFFNKETSPTIKQGIAALRCAWLLDEIEKKYPNQHYDWLAVLFRKKAQYLYNEALSREQNGEETLSGLKVFGPDIDTNFSYEGMLYLCAYLRYKFGPSHNPEERTRSLEDARRTISKLFGLGKASKDKPGAFLEHAREVYDTINTELSSG